MAISLPRAILFDLDETILTEGDRPAILLQVAEELAPALAPHEPVAIADRLEVALAAFWASSPQATTARLAIRQARLGVISEVFESLRLPGMPLVAERFCDRFGELRAMGTRVFPGARETIESIKQAGVLLALVTNGAVDIQRAKLTRFSLTPLFDHIQIEGEYGFGKPEVRAYTHAMQTLGARPADTWMVGDNLEWEVAAPQRLGIYSIWHDHRGKGLPPDTTVRPDRIIRRLPELLVDP